MPGLPLGIQIPKIRAGAPPEKPLAPRIDLLLHLPLRGRVARPAQFDGTTIVTGERQRFGMQLAALAHGVFDDRLRPVIEALVRHAAKEGQGMLVAGPEGGQILPVRVLHIRVSAVAERHMKGIQGPGRLPPRHLLIAPIHLGLVTGGRFEADMGVDRAQRPQRPD
jgi:hypothetical protein